jgi:hypothetical protein
LLQKFDSRLGGLSLFPNDRNDKADGGQCDCYPSCTIHTPISLKTSFAL